MLNLFSEIFSYPFMVRALLVGSLVALCSALLGVSLVLKRYAMIGDGLSHVGFGALAVATALNASPLLISLPIVLIAAMLLLRLSESSKIKGDSAVSIISTGALAVGVMIVSLTTGMNTDVSNYLFGSILTMSESDVSLSVLISLLVVSMFVIFYNRIFSVTFDESFAQATGIKVSTYNTIIAGLTALVIVLGMRLMGALLITSLIVFPALTAMRLCKQFKTVIINSAAVSVVCLWLGVIISYVYATPTGASIVICNIIFFLIYFALQKLLERGQKIGKKK